MCENAYSHMNISNLDIPDYFDYLAPNNWVWECTLTHEHFLLYPITLVT